MVVHDTKVSMNYRAFDEASYYQGNKFQLGGNDRAEVKDQVQKTKAARSFRPDDRIHEDAWRSLGRNFKIDLAGIELSVHQGVLKLTGTVASLGQKQEVERAIELVPGVQQLLNELQVIRL